MNKQGLGKIEYSDWSWNVVTGCLHGCPYCFARRIAERFKGKAFPNGFKPTFHPERLREPLKLKKPARIFICDMGDLFGDWAPREWIDAVLETIRACPQHTFLLLTKNPKRYGEFDLPENAWAGTSAENQEAADKRVPELLKVKATVRWVSVEPMLSAVDLTDIHNRGVLRDVRPGVHLPYDIKINALTGEWFDGWDSGKGNMLSWIVCGAETGPGARPCHPDWIRGLRDQCVAAGVKFFFKQWGMWQNGSAPGNEGSIVLNNGTIIDNVAGITPSKYPNWNSLKPVRMARVGKKAAGRLLDGLEHNEFPEVPANAT